VRTYEQIAADAADDRPFSNHSEFEYWADSGKGCYDCRHEDGGETGCPILTAALLGGWPTEWTRRTHRWEIDGKSGSYEVVDGCTEFEARRDGDEDPPVQPPPPPPAELDGQIDVFEVFAERIAEQASQVGRVAVARG